MGRPQETGRPRNIEMGASQHAAGSRVQEEAMAFDHWPISPCGQTGFVSCVLSAAAWRVGWCRVTSSKPQVLGEQNKLNKVSAVGGL